MGAPRLGLGGTARQRHAVGTWGTGSRTCMLPTVGYRGSAQAARMAAHRQSSWQRTGSAHGSAQAARMEAHRQRAWQRTGSVHAVHRQHTCNAQAAHMQCTGSVRAAHRQHKWVCAGNTDLANESTRLGCNRSALKDLQGRGWQRHNAPSTE